MSVDTQVPAPSTQPQDSDDEQVLQRIAYRAPIMYAVAALIALFFLSRTESGAQTKFQLNSGSSWLSIPTFGIPALATIAGLAILMGIASVLAFVAARARRRISVWMNVAVGVAFVLSFLTWVGAGKASVIPITSLLAGALALSVPLIFGAMSGVVCERSGVINIAIEGQLLFGAFAAAVAASQLTSGYAGLVAAPVAGALVGALLAWFAVSFRVNQIIVGVVLNTLIIGLTGFFFSTVLADDKASWNSPPKLPEIDIPILSEIPVIGPVLFEQTILVYLMYAVVIALQFMLFRSRWGLRTRAVGEHPRAADTVGIKVNVRRVWNTILGGAIAGLGGAFFTVGSGLAFGREMSAGQGYIALAAMILGKWSPKGAVLAALLFGFSKNLGNVISTIGSGVPSEVLLMLPYLITIFAVAGFVGRVRPPAAEGTAYTKS
ncbi:MAG: ABC transporter permease [Ornithinimicrobium sp.]